MSVAVVPNCLRGTASADTVAHALGRGAGTAPGVGEVVLLPAADGGDGTTDVLARSPGAVRHVLPVSDALGRRKNASWLLMTETTAVVESAASCGLASLRPAELDPLRATSAGVGEMIAAAVEAGARHILLGAGGTAYVDAGAGALGALGARFFDATGATLPPVPWALRDVASVDLRPAIRRLGDVTIQVLADVRIGLDESIGRFGRQKGVTEANRGVLAETLARIVRVLAADEHRLWSSGAERLWTRPWLGAGGGVGAGLATVATTSGESGALRVLDLLGAMPAVLESDVAITAEGRVDATTWLGKLPGTVASLRTARGLPTVIVAADADLSGGAPEGGLVKILPFGADAQGEPPPSLADMLASTGARACTGRTATGHD
ncbi:glycerate kinase [Thermomonospora echinospora]|uniref:Glycerate kinase n=1 Tax=Thermomonospora echinospora TaxID=1992 RepID=A0A1H6DVW5_9ACTN|nr:glycerate kinase [Thermomonospora echinospora]SEG89398.1 glycerate kinase [Thermomonospora echinospora]